MSFYNVKKHCRIPKYRSQKSTFLLVITLSLFFIAGSTVAQTNADSNEDSDATEQSEKNSTAQSSEKTTTEPDPGFIPSEEISEDLSVSFPTDI